MKNTLFISILLIAFVSNAQTIKATVTEAQIFGKLGVYEPDDIINNPDIVKDNKQIDCDYLIDLQQKTVAFTSRSAPGSDTKLPINNISKQGSLYVFEINDFGRFDASYKYPAKIYLDVKKKTMIYAWYDQYGDRSFVSRINKLSINVSKSTSS
jgi:hypothetical protein